MRTKLAAGFCINFVGIKTDAKPRTPTLLQGFKAKYIVQNDWQETSGDFSVWQWPESGKFFAFSFGGRRGAASRGAFYHASR